MKIGLVRHGLTDWNAKQIIQGQSDIPLNAEGRRQAEQLAERLLTEQPLWDAVCSSDLARARVTAETVANKLGIPLLEPDIRLRERFFGQIEGTTLPEREARWGTNWRNLELGIESDEDMRRRGVEALEDLAKLQPRRNVLIVSHGSFIAQLLLELCHGLEDARLDNVSYSVLEQREGKWQTLLHNCTKHLQR